MGRGSSKVSGGSAGAGGGMESAEAKKFIDEMAAARNSDMSMQDIAEGNVPLSNSDLQAAVEAFALEHKGVDENELMDAIKSKSDQMSKSAKTPTNDYKTWTVGTKVEFNGGDDFGVAEGVGRRGIKGKWESGTVKEVHSDHIIVDVPGTSSHMWLDEDTASQFRLAKSGASTPKKQTNKVSNTTQIKLKQQISSLKSKDIDNMSRSQLLKHAKTVMLARVGEPFQAKTKKEALARFDLLSSAQSTAYLKKLLKREKSNFSAELKKK